MKNPGCEEEVKKVRLQELSDIPDSLQRFSSRVLWHFTGYEKTADDSFDILNKILTENRLKIGARAETVRMSDGIERYAYPVSCMCDIPLRDLRIHIARYGSFGLAFHKNDAITKGHFNPVFYIHKDSQIFEAAGKMVRDLEGMVEAGSEMHKVFERFLRVLGSFCKRSDLTRSVIRSKEMDRDQANNFYFEREWRSGFDWDFEDSALAAIMMPTAFLSRFRERWRERFAQCSLISSEIVDLL